MPLAGIRSPHGHPQCLLRAHQDDEFLTPGDRRVQEVPLEHQVVLGVQGEVRAAFRATPGDVT